MPVPTRVRYGADVVRALALALVAMVTPPGAAGAPNEWTSLGPPATRHALALQDGAAVHPSALAVNPQSSSVYAATAHGL